ncbi:hypothetical protein [Alkalimarinus sediminis]|uniref:Uncharacterized protein n=1 Tax=Alkalimarinus sediminis TaxID=1632866 RepID=A0A9E8HHP6_9ALTE|nr:hypothetical protein [Alkalimarinus sediminis]UZW73557.1 hypothetical protein NNL22_10945 [Alkalimarinus sediminis]
MNANTHTNTQQKVITPTKPATEQNLEALGIRKIRHFDKTRIDSHPQSRLDAVRSAGHSFRDYMLSLDSQVIHYSSVNLIRAPYPTKYGLLNAAKVASPYMHIMNRLFIIQYKTTEGIKTLLFSPSDIDGNRETPYFKRVADSWGVLAGPMESFMAPIYNRVEDALEQAGIKPEDIDFISYDHLHTQDIRKWLGSDNTPALFPNAKLLVMKQEWDSTLSLLPPQQEWYCPNGIQGIDKKKLVLLDSSVMLGDSVALVQTPGHTEGNHSLVAHTPEGLFVTSENGVSADSYSPLHSSIPGVRKYAKETGMEVILNGNTLEGGLDQYMSMVLEKTIAGPSTKNPDFCNFVPSSELTAYWGFPGLKPTFTFGELSFGQIESK